MSEEEAIENIQSLRKEIERHNDLYYRRAEPEISDFNYDRMKRELAELETLYPELTSQASLSLPPGRWWKLPPFYRWTKRRIFSFSAC